MGDTRTSRSASSLPVQPCVSSTDSPITLLKWTSRPASPVLSATTEEQNGDERVEGRASVPVEGGVVMGDTGTQKKQVYLGIMSLGQQMLQMQKPLMPHMCDFVLGEPMGTVLRPTLKQVMLVLLVSLPHLEHGITLSWPNAFAAQLSSENSTLFNNHQLHFTPLEMDMVGSLLFAGQTIAAIPLGSVIGRFGRRLLIICGCFPLVSGWLFILFAHHVTMVLIGRFLCGLGVLIMMVPARVHALEITNISFRGMTTVTLDAMKFVGYIALAWTVTDISWYTMAMINAILVVIFGVTVSLVLPESPAFLAVHGKEAEARDILKEIRDVIISNTTRMLKDLGITLDHDKSTLIISSASLSGIILMGSVVDILGRRFCLMTSLVVMTLGYCALGFYAYFLLPPPLIGQKLDIKPLSSLDDNAKVSYLPEGTSSDDEGENYLIPLSCFIGIAFSNAAGMNPIPIMVVLEYFPTSIRAEGMSICMFWMDFITTASLQLYSTLVEGLTLAGLYWQYALISAAAMLHIMFFIRETNQQNIG